MSFVESDECARLITQFWARISRAMSTTEIDGLNNFINSEILELAPQIQYCETALRGHTLLHLMFIRHCLYKRSVTAGGQGGKLGTTVFAFKESFNFPFQIKNTTETENFNVGAMWCQRLFRNPDRGYTIFQILMFKYVHETKLRLSTSGVVVLGPFSE
jgi:hypothetical protein